MNRTGANVVLKYCEVLDEFIRIRVLAEEEAQHFLRAEGLTGKRAYQQLVIQACVLHYRDRILPRLQERTHTEDPELIEDFLYHLCVEVNPHLEIHNVMLPAGEGPVAASGEGLTWPEGQVRPERPESRAAFLAARVLDLERRLRREVVGQKEAVAAVARAVRKAAAGLKPPHRPVGTFLFIGRTGVGKTELAKALARTLWGDLSRLVRIDCSEYSQPHEYSKLIGAPPGYVGHNEGGQLTEKVKALGSAVVLFDEIEKAHDKLHNILLQIFDEAFVTDSHGERVQFDQCILIMTSNVGTAELEALSRAIGFGAARGREPTLEEIRAETFRALKRKFRPEFLNRIDEILVFNPLTFTDCLRITDKLLTEVARLARRVRVHVRFDRAVKEFLTRQGYSPEYGARELRRVVTQQVENPLAEAILLGKIPPGSRVRFEVRRKRLTYRLS